MHDINGSQRCSAFICDKMGPKLMVSNAGCLNGQGKNNGEQSS